jgi:dihydropyrimidinase
MADSPVYFVHLSRAEVLDEVTSARHRDRPVFAETCPHYLFLDSSVYDDETFDTAKYVLTPPLRAARHQADLWRGLRTDLQVVSTDHCPFCLNGQKTTGAHDFSKIPNGGPGIEHRLQLLYSGGVAGARLSLRHLVDVFAATPARLFGLYPRKGTIAVGSDADFVVFDPAGSTTIRAATPHMNVDYSLYEGWRLTGAVRTVIAAGRAIVDNGVFTGKPGAGRYLARDVSGQL